jgi:dipeptidyl aminopeptidase/acylaminoacyl peptidase
VSKTIAPYGSWASPISIEEKAGSGEAWFGYSVVDLDERGVLWIEQRAAEGGRAALMREGVGEVVPGFDARTRVHEYGGGAVWQHGDSVFLSSFADSRVYRVDAGGGPYAVTPEPSEPHALRYADGDVTPDGVTVICVRETHGDSVVNELVAFPADGSAEPRPIATGRDFYASPRISPDGTRLAWLAWDHPLLPFLGCELWTSDVDGADVRRLTGGPDEAVFQPEWGPDGRLHWVSDRDGWWNLYRDDEQLTTLEAELGTPSWSFNMRTYGFLDDGRVACTVIDQGVHSFAILEPESRELTRLALPFTASVPYLSAHGNRFAVFAGTPTAAPVIARVDADTGAIEEVATTWSGELEEGSISVGRPIEFQSTGGRRAHAFYYPPANADFEAPEGELPPLRVLIHGGPTSQGRLGFDPTIQFLTTRGWAVVDVDYGGSTGYGREYRMLLHREWGVVDVDDCIAAAQHLGEIGEVDAKRMSIAGGSAGGYTTLLALALSDVFAAGTSAFGVTDLVSFATVTHKFEAHYLDWLLGPLPEALDVYRERSPVTHADEIRAAVLITQGLDDKVVPPSQAEQIVAALERNGVPHEYIPLEGEGHGFRRRESLLLTLGASVAFYGQVFGFQPADDVEPVRL